MELNLTDLCDKHSKTVTIKISLIDSSSLSGPAYLIGTCECPISAACDKCSIMEKHGLVPGKELKHDPF